ncbi:amidase [Kribbella sp. CA-293567]|uniref:amidase n=1 Tax=Kribbella sp. CA-293567 TaxID=3002436 RepID=UPI0022DDBBEA|nr:amidase [Kribbella sp. CA-293567]WBQ08273.1 amidase [Kribbella sp. CA-293567]
MTSWLHRFSTPTSPGNPAGPRVAVKDAIDVAGVPTTAGCPAVGDHAEPAATDAPVVARVRAGGGTIVGKTNLTELCRPPDGVNPWTGTARNPLDRKLVPGGSSSGSGVVVAAGEADLAIATDTGGSSRIPAACCGVAGLKTTAGRLPLDGVFPYAPSLDVVGVLAREVEGLTQAMGMLEPGFVATPYEGRIGRLRLPEITTDPVVDQAVDDALARSGYEVVDVPLTGWLRAGVAAGLVITAEGHAAHRHLLDGGRMSDRVREWIERGKYLDDELIADSRQLGREFRALLDTKLAKYGMLALPTLVSLPPRLGEESRFEFPALTAPLNLTGHPAVAVPVPLASSPVPASVQLIGPHNAEGRLLSAASALPGL